MIVLSVIIPVFNSEPWLCRCLDSVVSQRFDNQFEIILIDDGSTDGSGAICDNYACRYSNVKVFHLENRGASLARKYGIERAQGQFVTFIDSDDFVKEGYFETLYQLSQETGCAIAACAVAGIPGPSGSSKPNVLLFEELMPRFFKYEFWGLVAKIYALDLFAGIDFPSASLSEDYFVIAHLFERERKMAFSPVALYVYDHHEQSLSHTPISKKAFEEFENVKGVLDFTSVRMPQYRDYALSNTTETAVKLLLASRKDKTTFQNWRKTVSSFLADNRFAILTCKPLLFKTRLMAFLFSFKELRIAR